MELRGRGGKERLERAFSGREGNHVRESRERSRSAMMENELERFRIINDWEIIDLPMSINDH